MGGFQPENKLLAAMTTATPPHAENSVSSATPPPPSYFAQLRTPKANEKPMCRCHNHLSNLITAVKALVARHDALAFHIDKDRSVEQVLRNTLSWRLIQVAGVKWIAFASCASESKDGFSCCCHEEYAWATDAVQALIERIGTRPASRQDLESSELRNREWNDRVRADALLLEGLLRECKEAHSTNLTGDAKINWRRRSRL